jgi:hypothetical protein
MGLPLFHWRYYFSSPLHFDVASFFIGGLCFWAPCVLGLLLFSSDVFIFEPLVFWGCLFFRWRSLFSSPLHFGVASFFVGGLYFWAPYILGLPLFLSDVFIFEPLTFWGWLFFRRRFLFSSHLRFGVASFFIGCLYFWANERGVWWHPFVRGSGSSERNSHLSNTELAWLVISLA